MSECPDCAAPAKFKKGDRVRLIDAPSKRFVGAIGTVASDKECDLYWVDFDGTEYQVVEKQMEGVT